MFYCLQIQFWTTMADVTQLQLRLYHVATTCIWYILVGSSKKGITYAKYLNWRGYFNWPINHQSTTNNRLKPVMTTGLVNTHIDRSIANLAFKCNLDHLPAWTNVSNVSKGTSTLQGQHLCQIIWNVHINVQVMAQTYSVYDHFIICPWSGTLTFDLPEEMFHMAILFLKDNICAKLFWNPCINVQVMAKTSQIYDHFIIWPSSVTVTFKQPEEMFQTAPLLLMDNNCAWIFSNLCINVQVMAQTNLDGWMHASTYTKLK